TSKLRQSVVSSKMPNGFQSKVVAPRNPKLVKKAEKPVTLTPSAFLKEMSLTTEQRLASTHEMRRPRIVQLLDMSETSHQKFSALDLEQSLFQPFPSEVVFQNYVPCEIYEVPLILRNNDKIPRLVKVVLESSPYFKLISPNDVCHKVAPGMPSTFRIVFTPEENKDYFHQVTCITEREKFIVPIRAIGARAILDFPDQLNFSVCPVKYTTQKTLLVRNIGNREARYCISTQSPFSVDPSIGTLGIGEIMQVTVDFHPLEAGDHFRALIVHYDTGEDIHTSLYGAAVDVNIRLDKNSLVIEKTYLMLANHRAVVIHNRSEIIAHFQWKAFATQEEEDHQKMRLCCKLQSQEEDETDRFLKECNMDPTLRERLSVLSRTFQSHQAKVKGDSMLFSDDIFSIEPVEGDVWPNSTAEINVIFKPREARVYQQTVYCNISGRETRLPLRIRGEGIGPRLRFSFNQLDIGKVFVGSAHSYEAILFNKGAIDAFFTLVPPATALGSCFTFHPQEGIVLAEGLQVIQISFRSTVLGEFTEEFRFSVNGSPEAVTLTIRGCVIGPTFHFNVPSLHFGDVSFGFPCTLSCCLNNTSLVPMTFTLRIPGDGPGEPSVSSFAQISDDTRPSWRRGVRGHVKPTEFTITPCRGTVRSQGLLDIQVTLCSNTVKKYELALVVDVDGVGKEVLALLLTARCIVPPLRVLNPVVKFGRCFLKFPCRQTLTLVNDSDLPGCYGVLPQVWHCIRHLFSPVTVGPLPCGIIQPRSSVAVPFMLEAQVTGEQDTVAHIAVFGSEGSPLKIHLVSTGEGPVVYVHPNKIDFGSIQVLRDVSRTLHLSNQTVIPASFWAQMADKCSRWRIEPSEGVVPPETEVSVIVIAHLDDTEKFKDKVNLFIEHNSPYEIPVQAVGIGTTIVTDKAFAPELNLGPHFSQEPCYYHFKITNQGRRTHQLYWTTEGFAPFRQRDHLPSLTHTKSKNLSRSVRPASPVFKLRPLRMELTPGKTMDMMLEGFSRTPKVAKERLLCHAIVGSKAGKTQIMQVDVMCEFIAPVLQISSREITFRVEKEASDVLTPQFKCLDLKNISSLPLNIVLSIEHPFSLCDVDQQPICVDDRAIKLEVGEELHLSVRFNPAYHEGLDIRVAKAVLMIRFLEHSHEECIALRGEVYFPNLHFQTMALDFGCILNDTEDVRYIEMTNCSPLPVRYDWSFLTDSHVRQMRYVQLCTLPGALLLPGDLSCRGALWAYAWEVSCRPTFIFILFSRFSSPKPTFLIKLQPPKEAQMERSAAAEDDCSMSAVETQSLVEIEGLLPVMETEQFTLGVEEVFDILPLYGVLQPGESQRVTFTFYGHTNIVAHVTAQCKVEGGPTYEIALSGEASLINYLFDVKEIDCGLQLFNEVSEVKLTLQNSGKVGFKYMVLNLSMASADNPLPGVPLVVPATGYVGSGKEQILKVYYLPGVPGDFYRTFRIQVGHLEPEEISLKGEGVFPRICMDLPRNIKGNKKYEKLLKEAKEKLEKDNRREEAVLLGEATAVEPHTDDSDSMFNTWLLMEMERALIEEHALKVQKAFTSCPTEDPAFGQRARQRLVKAQLPEYILDLGYIIPGNVHTHIVRITNTGHFPVSFHADGRALRDTGFSVGLHHVKQLPFCETEMFAVHFDSQSANLPLGEVKALLPIKVTGGPTFHICLRAMVAVPSLCLSRDKLEFSAVQCGQCQEETIQLHNQLQIACKWFISTNEHVKKVDKHLPANLRRKLHQELKTKTPVFQVLPSSGNLTPGQRCNLQVRFSPSEERSYSTHLKINICKSNQHPELQLSGRGLEPRLEFNPPVLELGPLLPYSSGAQATVVVKNPCEFPIEFYSLEFDQQYLAEELILRMLKDYDCHNTLLLPPRAPGEKLPPEVLEYYEDQKRQQDEQAKSKPVEPVGHENENSEDIQSFSDQGGKDSAGVVRTVSSHTSIIPSSFFDESKLNKVDFKLEHEEEAEEDVEKRSRPAEDQQKHSSSKEAVGELDNSPVTRAIARHLGIDISPEGRAARNRRGIVVIIHGAPLTGKTSAAVALSKYYGAACLSIDSVVKEAISERTTLAGLNARELYFRAAVGQAHKDTEDAGQRADLCSLPLGAEARRSPNSSSCSSNGKTSLQPFAARGPGSLGGGKGKTEGHIPQPQKQLQTDQVGSHAKRGLHCPNASIAGEMAARTCVLPEDLLVTILSERMQLSDCYQGVVFDGLETLFAHNMPSALLCLLKAINNRPYIYFVNLFQDYATMKAKEKAKKEQEEREQQEAAMREKARLQDMDEEAYDALTEEQKSQFDNELRHVLRERKKREMEKLARELEEKKHQQELERLKEEEELKKKAKRWKKDLGKEKDNTSGRKSQFGVRQGMSTSTSSDIKLNEGDDRRGSAKEHPDSVPVNKEDKKKRNKFGLLDASPVVVVSPADPEQDETEKEALSDKEKSLALRFKLYEASQKDITHILSFWNRVKGILLSPLNQEEVQHEVEEQRHPSSSRRSRKDREKERQERLEKERLEKERLEKERLEKLKALEDSKLSEQEKEGAEGSGKDQDTGVSCLDIQVLSSEDASGKRILESGKLPDAEQILDSLGLGRSGPPIPPTAFYSVIHYPEKRTVPAVGEALQHFVFVAPEGATAEEEKKDTESLVDTPVTPAAKIPEEQITPPRGRVRKEKAEGSRESSRDKRSTGRGRRGLQGPASAVPARHPDADQSNVSRDSSLGKIVRLTDFRWIVPAHGEVVLKIHFSSIIPGQFDQTFNFEILGTHRLYQLYCRGTCMYPTISQDPRLVFPHRRKSKAHHDIIFKQYVMDTGVFHFGPLLCGKSRHCYKALCYPANCEKITILNITPLEAEVHFFLEHDANADTFLFEPPRMTLKPNEKQELTIWAYPTSAGIVEDNLVCCIKDNPKPVVFRLCCHGVRLELGVNCKQLHFDKLLLHRKASKTLVLQNSNPLPAVWRLCGMESLGEDFSVSQDHGTIGPYTEFSLKLHFKATKALNVKKTIRLEVSDAENILGIVQIENIQIFAEAYDVALNITFPKVADSNLDFGILKVMDEAKITLNLKNKGKYEIAYSFRLETAGTNIPDLTSHFSIQPQKGVLTASERPAQVQMVFHPKREIKIEDKPILQCQLIEPNVCEGGEIIAVIPVRVSANALFTKYSIYPASVINFGAMMSGTKKSCTFTLENKGILDFKFLICRTIRDVPILPRKGTSPVKYTRSHESETSSKILPSVKQSKQTDSLQKDLNPVTQARITLGMFTVYPGFGSISPGGHQVITVDCYADPLGTCEEYLSIDISDRDPKDNPLGIPYTLAAESCLPAFVVDDIGSIFEEHRICSNINLCHILQTVQDKGVFVTDENTFIFTNVLVGHQATARFKICNVDKIPCDVVLSIKPTSSKLSTHVGDVFKVDPVRMCVPSRSHAFATVTFTPQTMQNYQCTFEASLDVLASPVVFKPQSLTFTISGDGNLPRVTILRPVLHNKRGNPLLLFKKLLLGHSEKLPLILHNSGIIPVQLLIDLLDEEGVFFLKARPTTHCISQAPGTKEGSAGKGRKPHTISLVLNNGESAEFDVLFKPNLTQHAEGKIRLSVVDNPYEETNILLVGEGYQDDFTLDNIHGLVADSDEENTEDNLEEDIVEAARADHIQFGGCHIGTPYQVTFTITNHSSMEAMRFEWMAGTPFHFSPQVGHLHAGCAKDITVTLKSDVAVTFKMHPVKCKVARIAFQLPADQVPDWDDRLHTVKWVDATRSQPTVWPVKKKVIETDPEPAHTVLEESSREVELRLSAVVDYAEFKLDTDLIQFKETLLFQTRTFTFQLSNTGNVALEYTWMADVEDKRAVSYTGELLLTSPEGDFHSSSSGASVKLQASCCSSQMGCTLEHISSSLGSSLSTVNATPQFAVEPCSGTIPAGQEQLFQMKFSPVDVGEFESCMLCSIPNLKPNQKGPEVVVRGRSLLPHCHFELEDSDYVTANRRNPDLRGPQGTTLDPNTRVIEFSAVGVYSRNSRTFLLMNPTSCTYSFQWTCQDPKVPREQPAFSCLTERGQIQPEKKVEIKFQFIPQHLDITESFWVFTIPEQSVSIPFLLVGNATDPLVSLDRSHLNFHSLLVGHEMYQTIYMINSEKEAFSFAFRESSFFPEGCNASLKVEPLQGSIAPLSRCAITIFFIPILEGEVVFNLMCDVKRKPQPLSLNIKATAYSMNITVRFEDSDGCIAELNAQETNVIDFKKVELNENIQNIFTISNTGKLSFTFSWELSGPPAQKQFLTITPQMGTVEAEGKAEALLTFHPRKMCSVKDVELTLQISKGPTFICMLLATVVVPTVHFSFTKLNFGACFVYHAGMLPAQQTLIITNKADKDVSLNCLFTSTAHLEVDFPGYVLSPGGTVEVPITFYPREAVSYHELVPFEINGLSQQTVEVRGRGTEMKVDVVEPRRKVVKLGALSIGQTVKKIVTIANNSAAPLTFNLNFMYTMPELQEAGVLCLNPTNEISLKPKGDTCKVEVIFSPKRRILPFTEEVMLECHGLVRSLFMVQGSCQGISVSLDREHINFGAVLQQSCACQRIIMQNTGDIGVRFKWIVKSFKPDFSISPTRGYISPGMDVPFLVTFHPSKPSQAIQYDGLQCFIQGSEPLRLTLAGCCMEVPATKETLNFTCDVREKQSQTILLSNPSNEAWTMQPVIEGQHWEGPEFFHLDANQQNKPYEITYKPLTMTSENKKHEGSIFFPFPDGTGLQYLLQGIAEAPKCSGSIFREVPCRTPYTELIPVSNWLNRPQRFLVVVDILKPEKLESSSVLQGLEYIDVPGSTQKDYKLTFLSYKEGVFSTMVTFLNEVTEEYLFYMATFKATASGPISTIELVTPIRESVSSSISVDNPLSVSVIFTTDCKVPDINVPPLFTVPALSEANLVFEYQPLKTGESTGRLVLQSSDLGTFYYDLNLKATASRPEKPLYFCTALGSNQTITTKFINYARQKTDYVLQIDCADFQTEKTISVAPASVGGSEVCLEVTYEPCQLGESRATLLLSSPLGGEYSIPLFGLSVPPKPQGPFQIKAGCSTSIPFKNVFLQHMAFRYDVENPAFTVRATTNLRPKKTVYITVSFEGNPADSEAPVTSKLVVSCARAAGLGAEVSWVYYLRGI
ncbi:Hydrocephalus-inducing protein, partial [Struthio camelus australis]